jgi:hypothetical protein
MSFKAIEHLFRLLDPGVVQAALGAPARVTVDEVADTFGISRHHLVKVVHDLGVLGIGV